MYMYTYIHTHDITLAETEVIKTELCVYTEYRVYPGRGQRYIARDPPTIIIIIIAAVIVNPIIIIIIVIIIVYPGCGQCYITRDFWEDK